MKKVHVSLKTCWSFLSLYIGFINPAFAREVVFDHDYAGFTIQVPSTWVVEYPPGKGKNGPAVTVTTPDGGSKDQFLENCNVMIGSWPKELDESQLRIAYELGQAGLKQLTTDFKEVAQGETKVGPLVARWSISTYTAPGATAQGKQVGYMIANGRLSYSVICSALPTTFSSYEPIFREIANSLRMNRKSRSLTRPSK